MEAEGRVTQMCGLDDADRPVDCAQAWNDWAEVCACEKDLCNTFAFLRSTIDAKNLVARIEQEVRIYSCISEIQT